MGVFRMERNGNNLLKKLQNEPGTEFPHSQGILRYGASWEAGINWKEYYTCQRLEKGQASYRNPSTTRLAAL